MELIGYIVLFGFVVVGLPTLIWEIVRRVFNFVFGTTVGDWVPGSGSSNSSSDSPAPLYRESFVREVGQAGHLYTFVDDSRGTVVNKYGAPPEEATIITQYNKR